MTFPLPRSSALAGVSSGPTPELRVLFTQYYAPIWRLLRRLGVDPAQLDDAAQEVFWVAARRLQSVNPGSEHAFLYGVALRVASNERRKSRLRMPVHSLNAVAEPHCPQPTPEEALLGRQARELLDEVLARMADTTRTVLVLHEIEGLEIKVIAELEDIPIGTVGSRLRRAREEFSEIAARVRASLRKGER